jgi:hypothetical protein
MNSDKVTYWRSKDGGPWEQIDPVAHSIIRFEVNQIPVGDIYDDGYGNRYRREVKP